MRNYIIMFVIGAVAGAATYGYFKPGKNTTSQAAEAVTKYQIVTQERVVERPGGVREIIRTVTDSTVKAEKSTASSSTVVAKNWNLGLSAGTRPWDWQPQYAIQLQRRVLGPVFLGAYGRTDGEIGALLSVEF